MSPATAKARTRFLRWARKLEKVAHDLWREEAALTRAAASGDDPEAAELSSDVGCICVDHLHPSIEALRKAAAPKRRPEDDSGEPGASLAEASGR